MTSSTISRRALLGASVLSSLSFVSSWHQAYAQEPSAGEPVRQNPVLLCVFLRGAADGLNLLVPHADEEYYRLRPTIAVPRPDQPQGAIDLDGHFGLHPRLAPLKAAYDAHELALIHAVGSPHPTRSHFEAQDYMTSGAVGERKVSRGWLTRYLSARSAPGAGLLRAVALTERPPLALRGYPDLVVAPSLRDFRLETAEPLSSLLSRGFSRLYAAVPAAPAERAGQRALEASRLVEQALASQRPSAKFARDVLPFAEVARLIKADVGLESAWIDLGGWDTHRRQGSTEGGLSNQIGRLARALAAFRTELGSELERVIVVVMSEFGRTAKENGTGGTDHGHGNAMLLLGGKLRGGRVLGRFPGLGPEQLFERRDLAVSTDFRDVLAELCEGHLSVADASPLFPGFQRDSSRLGLFS